jgi:hypothetical protein
MDGATYFAGAVSYERKMFMKLTAGVMKLYRSSLLMLIKIS